MKAGNVVGRFAGWLGQFPTLFKEAGEPLPVKQEPKSALAKFSDAELARKIGDGFIYFRLGNVEGRIYGGPYRNKPADIHGVKMAMEINAPCTVDVPTKDFNVPDTNDLRIGLMAALALLKEHGRIYVGCMGGIGRTGLFMAAMAKMMDTPDQLNVPDTLTMQGLDPAVAYVRQHYKRHAVETGQQLQYISQLFLSDIQQVGRSL